MSDKELLDNENEQLDEFKASFGDPSEVPEPAAKKAPARKGDKNVEDDPQDAPTAVKAPGTKASIIHAVMNKMNGMDTKMLKASYGKMMASMTPGMNEETESDEDVVSIRELPRVSAEDIDVREDVSAMFEGTDDLTEEFKEKATTIFEAAVLAKVNEHLEKISINFESELDEEIAKLRAEQADQLDSYLDYVVEQWMDQNRLAVEQGIKADMVEDFIKGLKGLFEDHYVTIPDEKVDVVEELASKVEEIEALLDEEIAKNVELNKLVEETVKDKLVESVSEDLTETQKAKFKTLAEGIDFTDSEAFEAKLSVIKESYFGMVEESTSEYDFDEVDPLEEEVTTKKVSDPTMAGYVNAISRSIKK